MPINPSISIITATLNAAKVLPNLIESVRQQTDHQFEWIIVDGASIDGTLDIIKSAGDVVTKFVSEPDFGIYDAINKAIKMATGDYYLVLGADDLLKPEAIALYRRAVMDTKADLITGAIEFCSKIKRPGKKFIRMLGIRSIISAHSVGCLIRTSLHERFGFYSRRFSIGADTEFLLKSYLNGATVEKTYEVVGTHGAEGMSGKDLLGCFVDDFRIQVESGSALWWETIFLFSKIIPGYKRIRMQINNRP